MSNRDLWHVKYGFEVYQVGVYGMLSMGLEYVNGCLGYVKYMYRICQVGDYFTLSRC